LRESEGRSRSHGFDSLVIEREEEEEEGKVFIHTKSKDF
jgi:hypothetical protein